MDNMLIDGTHIEDIDSLKLKLIAHFDMKDLGHANHILGMRIMCDSQKRLLYLSQSEYVDKVRRRFNMEGGKIVSVPLASYLKLCQNDCPKLDADKAEIAKVPYLSAIGSLMYAMICTQPDIAVGRVSIGTCQILAKSIGRQ